MKSDFLRTKIHHLADQMISVDLDDGVKKNQAVSRMFWLK